MNPRLWAIAVVLWLCSWGVASAANSAAKFGGIGIDGVPQVDGQIVVRQLVVGGPAQQAGIRIGDIITHVDSKPTKGSDFRQIVDYRLRGRAGTKALVTVRRKGSERPLSFTLVRRQLLVNNRR